MHTKQVACVQDVCAGLGQISDKFAKIPCHSNLVWRAILRQDIVFLTAHQLDKI